MGELYMYIYYLVLLVACLSLSPLYGKKQDLKVGMQAPAFSLLDQDGKMVTLGDLKKSYVVIYFYPKDDTPVCSKQACSIRDKYQDFKDNNIIVLGISYDKPASHKKFKEKLNLPFRLLSDEKQTVAKAYGAKRSWPFSWLFPYPLRNTLVIDPDGMICAIMPDVEVSAHVSDIMDVIKKDKVRASSTSLNQ